MFDTTQLMKGVLEGCILQIISHETAYGYQITTQLQGCGFDGIREGTTYPIFMRLEKKGLVTAELRPSPLGPARKYYTITDTGKAYLQEFNDSWRDTCRAVNAILEGSGPYENTAPAGQGE